MAIDILLNTFGVIIFSSYISKLLLKFKFSLFLRVNEDISKLQVDFIECFNQIIKILICL
jgi:hypothetical protein